MRVCHHADERLELEALFVSHRGKGTICSLRVPEICPLADKTLLKLHSKVAFQHSTKQLE